MKKIMVLLCLVLMVVGAGSAIGFMCSTPDSRAPDGCACKGCTGTGLTVAQSDLVAQTCGSKCDPNTGTYGTKCAPQVGGQPPNGITVGCTATGGDCMDLYPCVTNAPEFSTYGIIAAVVIIAGIVGFLIYKKKKAPELKK